MRIGFLGVGTVSTAVIHGMSVRPGPAPELLLSPRSRDAAEALAAAYPHCRRLASNQAVVDECDIVVLSMLPSQLEQALGELTLRSDQIVASFVATFPPSRLRPLVAPATRVAQLIPLPAIAIGRGPLVVSPPLPELLDAFDGLGDLVVLEDEQQIRTLSVASAVMSTHYQLQNVLIDWIAGHGLDPALASAYMRSLFHGLAAVGRRTAPEDVGELPKRHETPGGLNERIRAALLADGWFARVPAELDHVYANAVLTASTPPAPPANRPALSEAPPETPSEAAEWDERYATSGRIWSGQPNGALVQEVTGLAPGRVLDVGCGEGADAVWLASRGWDVTALDVSQVALDRAREHAAEAGVTVQWVHSGLLDADLPSEGFELVSAQYPALRRTAGDDAERALLDAVAPGGTLLVVHHLPDREAALQNGFDLDEWVGPRDVARLLGSGWQIELDEVRERFVDGGAGAHHTHDVVLRARRLA